MPAKKQHSNKGCHPENESGSVPLTVENFEFAFEKALGAQSVRDTLHEALGPLIELLVSQRVAKVEETFTEKVKELKREHESRIEELRGEINDMKQKQNDLEQYSKREDLIIKGLQVPQTFAEKVATQRGQGESDQARVSSPSVVETVVNFFEKEMGVRVPTNSISTAHPLPSRSGPPSVIVRFSSRDVRNSIYSRRFTLKGRGLFVDEHLTPHNSKLMFHARKLKVSGKVLDCFTRNCSPYVRLVDRRVVPFSMELLHNLGSG